MEEILLNKKEFIEEVSRRCMVTNYVVEEIYNISSGLVTEKLIVGEDVELPKFGKFTLSTRKAMVGKNLFGDSEKSLQQCIYPSFKICNAIKTRVKNGHKYQKAR